VELDVDVAPIRVAFSVLVEAYGCGVSCAYKQKGGNEVMPLNLLFNFF
jgi:hypothetical protein